MEDDKETVEQLLSQINDLINSGGTADIAQQQRDTENDSDLQFSGDICQTGNQQDVNAVTTLSEVALQNKMEIRLDKDHSAVDTNFSHSEENVLTSTALGKGQKEEQSETHYEKDMSNSAEDKDGLKGNVSASQDKKGQPSEKHMGTKMLAKIEDTPSCSKTDNIVAKFSTNYIILNKIPVIMLTKLDPDITSLKIKSESKSHTVSSHKQQRPDVPGPSRKAAKKSEVKKKAWYDDDASLSDLSVSDISISDNEELFEGTLEKSKKNGSQGKGKPDTAQNSKQQMDTNSEISEVLKLGSKASARDQKDEKQEKKEETPLSKSLSASSVSRPQRGGNENKKRGSKRESAEVDKREGKIELSVEEMNTDTSLKTDLGTGFCNEGFIAEIGITSLSQNKREPISLKEGVVNEKSNPQNMASTSSAPNSVTRQHSDKSKTETVVKDMKDGAVSVKRETSNTEASRQKSRTAPRSDSHKKLKRTLDTSQSESAKKAKTETLEKVVAKPEPVSVKENPGAKDKVLHKSNIRYQLSITPVSLCDLGNEAFRKFINLAADCGVSFSKKGGSSSIPGKVELYFGDFVTLQSAMQRLAQLPSLANSTWVKGVIRCFEIKPSGKRDDKDQWNKNLSAQLFFQFSTSKADKLRQLCSYRDRKKEGTKRKCALLHKIPSSVNQEMLSLLFPFSLSVSISDSHPTERGVKGPVEVEFESPEWMEAVLLCFRQFAVGSKPIIIKNYTPPQEKSQEKNPLLASPQDRSSAQQHQRRGFDKGFQDQRGQGMSHDQGPPGRNQGSLKGRGPVPVTQRNLMERAGSEQSRYDQRKRSFGHQGMETIAMGGSPDKRSRLDSSVPQWGEGTISRGYQAEDQPQQPAALEANTDALRKIALTRGLDPNNKDVIKILEMTSQLERLQMLVQQQTAQANSLGITGLPAQQALALEQSHERQQALARNQSLEALETMRLREMQQVMQAQRAERLIGKSQGANVIPAWQRQAEVRMLMEEEERRQQEYQLSNAEMQLKENIANRLKQLEELELKMRSRRTGQHQRESPKVAASPTAVGALEASKSGPSTVFPYGNAPPTSGILGASPGAALDSHRTRHGSSSPQVYHARKEERRTESPLSVRGRSSSARGGGALDSQKPARFSSPSLPHQAKHEQRRRESPISGHSGPADHHHNRSPHKKRTPEQRSNSSRSDRRTLSHERSDRSSSSESLGQKLQVKDSKSSKPRDVKQDYRNDRKRPTGRQKSRWDTNVDRQMGSKDGLPSTVDPSRNDKPLDFNKPPPTLTTEQAVKQDIERTRAVLTASKENDVSSIHFRPPSDTTKPPNEEAVDELCLPIQFGKNAVKKTPREIEDEKRKAAEEKRRQDEAEKIKRAEEKRRREMVWNQHAFGRGMGGKSAQGSEKVNVPTPSDIHTKGIQELRSSSYKNFSGGGNAAAKRGRGNPGVGANISTSQRGRASHESGTVSEFQRDKDQHSRGTAGRGVAPRGKPLRGRMGMDVGNQETGNVGSVPRGGANIRRPPRNESLLGSQPRGRMDRGGARGQLLPRSGAHMNDEQLLQWQKDPRQWAEEEHAPGHPSEDFEDYQPEGYDEEGEWPEGPSSQRHPARPGLHPRGRGRSLLGDRHHEYPPLEFDEFQTEPAEPERPTYPEEDFYPESAQEDEESFVEEGTNFYFGGGPGRGQAMRARGSHPTGMRGGHAASTGRGRGGPGPERGYPMGRRNAQEPMRGQESDELMRGRGGRGWESMRGGDPMRGHGRGESVRGHGGSQPLRGRRGGEPMRGRGGGEPVRGGGGVEPMRGRGGGIAMRGRDGCEPVRGHGGGEFIRGRGGSGLHKGRGGPGGGFPVRGRGGVPPRGGGLLPTPRQHGQFEHPQEEQYDDAGEEEHSEYHEGGYQEDYNTDVEGDYGGPGGGFPVRGRGGVIPRGGGLLPTPRHHGQFGHLQEEQYDDTGEEEHSEYHEEGFQEDYNIDVEEDYGEYPLQYAEPPERPNPAALLPPPPIPPMFGRGGNHGVNFY